jgi:hypothetical protein
MATAAEMFEEWLGDISENDEFTKRLYPFFLRVGVVKMAAPRHERFDFVREMGYDNINRIFNHMSLQPGKLTFVFPERHMSVHEQRSFMSMLRYHPDVDKITAVDIITSSPIMISDFVNTSIRILTWPDDSRHDGELNESQQSD